MGRKLRPLTPFEAEQLLVYGALDNPTRLLAYEIIYDEPGIAFSGVTKRLRVDRGLAAYHLAVLKAAGLVEFRYVRRSKETSSYRLTDFGERWYHRLFGTRRLTPKRTGMAGRRTQSRAGG